MKEVGNSSSSEEVRIKKVGVLSVALIFAIIQFIVGFLMSLPWVFFSNSFSSLFSNVPLLGLVTGVTSLLIVPLILGVTGFITGALSALLYNLGALITKGIKLYS